MDRQLLPVHAGSEGAADAGAVASAAVAECCCGRHRCFDGLLIYIFREGPLRSRSLCKCLSTLTASRVACAGVVFRWMVLPRLSVLKNLYHPLVGAPPVGSSAIFVCSSSSSCRLRCSQRSGPLRWLAVRWRALVVCARPGSCIDAVCVGRIRCSACTCGDL